MKKMMGRDYPDYVVADGNKVWYAVQCGDGDTDWGNGSYDLDEALELARLYSEDCADTHIAVIDEGPDDALCIDVIRDF